MNEFTAQFLLEARELTEQGSADLLALEQSPEQQAHLDGAFRAFHTLKGAAGIMEYAPMEQMLHGAEDLLQDIRSGGRRVTPELIDACLACIGQVVRWLDVIEQQGDLPASAESDAKRVARMLDEVANKADDQAEPDWADALVEWAKQAGNANGPLVTAIRYVPAPDALLRGEDPVALIAGLPGVVAIRLQPSAPWPPLAEMDPFASNLVIEALSQASLADIAQALGTRSGDMQIQSTGSPVQPGPKVSTEISRAIILAQRAFVQVARPTEAFAGALGSAARVVANVLVSEGRRDGVPAIEAAADKAILEGSPAAFIAALDALLGEGGDARAPAEAEPTGGRKESGQTSIRVDVRRIDAIVDLTGELLVVKNALAHWTRQATEGADLADVVAGLRTQHARLDRHVAELQRAVLDLRVLPLARVFGRFPLLVRETASRLGKQVAFRTEGDETDADKAVVEALFEPLLHVVRNAIDHGIELPDVRERAGKSRTATITMRGWREGDHVIIEVADDGRGIDPGVVRRLAVERGVVTSEALASMSDDDAVDLIFAPGFTTAAEVTDLSGRGVGMNAVRSAIGRLGGDVTLENRPGAGLVVRFTLPFTVMMTRVMTVEAGGQTFGLPFDAVQETVRAERSQIRPLGGGRAFVLRDLTVPVVNLAASLGLAEQGAGSADTTCLVVATAGGQRVGIEVDRPGEKLDLMLKPVEGVLAGMPAISGTSLMGDGRVLIVLDLGALVG